MSQKDDFLWLLKESVGDTGHKYQSSNNLTSNSHWSAAFLHYCAKKCSILNTIIPNTLICQEFKTKKDSYNLTQINKFKNLEEGDLILLILNSTSTSRIDRVGTVIDYDPDNETVDVILGDYGSIDPATSTVGLVTFDLESNCIDCFLRPEWSS